MRLSAVFALFATLTAQAFAATPTPAPANPVRALLITGGCCHDYDFQTKALTEGVKQVGNVTWNVVNEGGKTTRAQIKLYDDPNWAKAYDVVVHNECFADTNDPAYIAKILAGHRAGTPAVVIHCAMHTYRATDVDDWSEFLGVTSRRHDHMSRYPVKKVSPAHAIVKGMPDNWVTPKDELYIIEKLWPGAQALATSVSEVDGKTYPVAWINRYGKARVFGTTYGHSDEMFSDPVFLEYVSRGLLWSAGRLPE